MTRSGMVEGARLRTSRHDPANHGVQVLEHIARTYAHHVESMSLEERIACRITPRLIAPAVGLAIHFDYQAPVETCEVHGDLADWKLATELEAARFLVDNLP